ncbi:MAG: 16S rRNA (cytosine(1402)-N(4))-methyltransferase RsmH [bacterium]
MNEVVHFPVLLNEIKQIVREYVKGREKIVFVDCNLGLGGHSSEILPLLPKSSMIYLIDKDIESMEIAKKRLEKNIKCQDKKNVSFLNISFRDFFSQNLNSLLASREYFFIILMDLGISYYQIKNQEGFSYLQNTFLDMRYDKQGKINAYYVVNYFSEQELFEIFDKVFENQKISRKIVKSIINQRAKNEIKFTFDLNKAISKAVSQKFLKDCLQKSYLALRIAVNDELNELQNALDFIINTNFNMLLLIISYHSLEGRIIKNFVKSLKESFKSNFKSKEFLEKCETVISKIKPHKEEVMINKPSRSAILWKIVRNCN